MERGGAAEDGSASAPWPKRRQPSLSGDSRLGGVEKAVATKNDRIDALVAQGTMIRADLLTAIQSDLPGNVSAITREDVWSFDGRRVLIPAGTKLIGDYRSESPAGKPDIRRLDQVAARRWRVGPTRIDWNGRPRTGGAGGFRRPALCRAVRASILLSVIGGASQFIATLGQQSQLNNQQNTTQSYTDPVTGHTTTITSQPNQNLLNARQIGSQQISQSLTKLAEEALKDSINIPTTIYVDQGTRIVVFVKKDLDFSNFYPDPVKEALRELKHERQSGTR